MFGVLFIYFKSCPVAAANLLTFGLPANDYIAPICIIGGALQCNACVFARGCGSDIRPRERIKKYCPLGRISQYTPWGAGNVFDYMISED